jgi:molybdopterin-biosynthesis enzyme MoeA-like protein
MLPGVPEEMMAIFDDSVASFLRKIAGDLTFFEASLDVWGIPESELAPTIDKVMHDNPYVYIKSHPKIAEKDHHLELHLSTTSKDSNLARQRIGRSIAQISEMIKEKSGKVRPAKT